MPEAPPPFGGAVAGTELGPLRVTVSPAANERYWASAGVDHPALREGALYPAHRRQPGDPALPDGRDPTAPAHRAATGRAPARPRRDPAHHRRHGGGSVREARSRVRRRRRGRHPARRGAPLDVHGHLLRAMSDHSRTLLLTPELLRAYSRRGNFHSELDEAAELGLPGLVAQGMQVAGPAYGVLLDEWGEEFLEHGEIELKFVGMVMDGETVDATVTIDGDGDLAELEVVNRDRGRTAAVGRASRRALRDGEQIA